jgi:hypothetical protein
MNMNRMSSKSRSKARRIGQTFTTSLPHLIYSMITDALKNWDYSTHVSTQNLKTKLNLYFGTGVLSILHVMFSSYDKEGQTKNILKWIWENHSVRYLKFRSAPQFLTSAYIWLCDSPVRGDWFLEFSLLFADKSIHSAEELLKTAFP